MPSEPRDLYHKEIVYDRETHDYAMYLDGELIGFARTYHAAEVMLDQLVYELLTHNFAGDNNAAEQPGTDDSQPDRTGESRSTTAQSE